MRKAQAKLAQEVAQNLVGLIHQAKQDPGLLQIIGNRLAEEAALLGGPDADLVSDFGDKLAVEGLRRLVGERKGA